MGGASGAVRPLRCKVTTVVLGLCLSGAPAAAFDAQVAWTPVGSAAGYQLYIRQLGQSYGSGINVGLLQADPDGAVRYVTTGLPLGVTNFFAVTAYDASGRESVLSNELSLLVTALPVPTVTPTPTAVPSSFTRTATAAGSTTASATATRTPVAPSMTPTRTAAPPTPTASPSPSAPHYHLGCRHDPRHPIGS